MARGNGVVLLARDDRASGPRSAFSWSTLASVQGFRLANVAWKSGSPGAAHGVGLEELLGLLLADRVGEGVAELVEREREWPDACCAGSPGPAWTERRAEIGRGGTPRNGAASTATVAAESPRPATIWASRPAERVPDHRRLLVQRLDDRRVVVGHLSDRLVGEDFGVCLGLLDGLRVVGPPGSQRGVAGVGEDGGPPVPAARKQPEAVDEDDRRLARSRSPRRSGSALQRRWSSWCSPLCRLRTGACADKRADATPQQMRDLAVCDVEAGATITSIGRRSATHSAPARQSNPSLSRRRASRPDPIDPTHGSRPQ